MGINKSRSTQRTRLNPRSKAFTATRRHHHLEAAEDYTELISELIETKGEARTCDVAKRLGISHVSALRTIQRLQRSGFVETSRHRPLMLTEKGEKTARMCKERHQLLLEFFIAIGVPPRVAQIDVEGVEHHISPATLIAIKAFKQRMNS